MQDPWITVLTKLNLSRAEQAALKRFEQDPLGRGFLPVADILRSHRKHEESLELLIQGVERHPTFTVARVVLARELFAKGMVMQAWMTLEGTTQSLDENVLAQKLRFKLALLIGYEDIAREIARKMQSQQMHDEDTKALAELLRTSTYSKTQERLIANLRASNIEPLLPSEEELKVLRGEELNPQTSEDTSSPVAVHQDPEPTLEDKLQSFHVLPLNEVFRGLEVGQSADLSSGLELDSTTLADLYSKQGHYSKAIAIYRRLLRMTPNSDYLKRRIREVIHAEKQQRNEDLSIDPAVVDQMEAIEIIDEQIKYFNHLLERLDSQSWQNQKR